MRNILRALAIQPKLAIGALDDPAEHEADHVAEQVTRMPEPVVTADGGMALGGSPSRP